MKKHALIFCLALLFAGTQAFAQLSKKEKKEWKKKDFVISSFLWEELKIYRKLDSAIPIAVLTEVDPLKAINFGVEIFAFAINPWYKSLNKENVNFIHKKGFKT